MKKMLFAVLMLFAIAAQAVSIKIDMRDVWSPARIAGKAICAPGTGTPDVPCVTAQKDYAFTAQNCGFVQYLGQRIANCIVQDDFGTRTWVFATNAGSGWRAVGVIQDGIFDSDIQAAGSVSNYAASFLSKLNSVFHGLFVPACPTPGVHFGYLVERLQYDFAMNALSVNPDTGDVSLSTPPYPHNNCPQ